MMSEPFATSPDRSTLAAEMVLGLLGNEEMREAQELMLLDAEFSREVARWQAAADRWFDHIDGLQPSEGVWNLIERRLPLPDVAPTVVSSKASTLWKPLAMLSMAASFVLAVVLGIMLSTQGDNRAPAAIIEPAAVSQISGPDGAPLLSAIFHRDNATLRLRVADLAEAGKAPELWVLAGDRQPQSLGLLRSDSVTITVSPEVLGLLEKEATLAITLEPIDGAPHAAPSGAILGTAPLQAI